MESIATYVYTKCAKAVAEEKHSAKQVETSDGICTMKQGALVELHDRSDGSRHHKCLARSNNFYFSTFLKHQYVSKYV